MSENKLAIKTDLQVATTPKVETPKVETPKVETPKEPKVPRIHTLTPINAKERTLRFSDGVDIVVPGNQRDIAYDADLLNP